jgi:hypothetical protein
MGRKWFEDVVPAMVKLSSTQVQLPAPAHLTIGGQQYHLTSALSLTLSGLSATTLYMIYAVASAGVVSLVASPNANSVGPVGATSWRLVGAFYSNGSSQFGSFVTTEGIPQSSFFDTTVTGAWSTNAAYTAKIKRMGGVMQLNVAIQLSGAPTGTLFVNMPASLNVDVAKLPTPAEPFLAMLKGLCEIRDASANTWTNSRVAGPNTGTTTVIVLGLNSGSNSYAQLTPTFPITFATGDTVAFDVEVPVLEWSITPLKDL